MQLVEITGDDAMTMKFENAVDEVCETNRNDTASIFHVEQ